ncbi:sodium:solute symporter [Nesterenkonia lacusekhoensis]|uniref:SSS family solute:Na+ symporter n=1 Tax=Nesterenkonia lacusekhoensis TaxID=150832 RepID=A0ABS4T599_9MICC|nr:sodium:solute symporter family protein [Nesterenkonia lacusekhoensis]MBP2319164.1 SSS family solute:Na+ symporter [Nesterenkonia lacusekhoensis]
MPAEWVWTGVAAYVVVALAAALLSRPGRSEDMSAYFLGGRRMGGFVSAMSYSATTYSAFMMIGLAGLTYAGGVGALGFELLYLCGVTLVLVFGPRFWRVGKRFGYITPSEMIGHRYGSRSAGATTALASCIFLVPYAAVQLAGVGYLLSGMTGAAISFTQGTLLAMALAIVFAMVAGLRSVAWTDSLQSVLMILGATLVVIVVIWQFGGLGAFFDGLAEQPGAMSVPGEGYFSFSTFLALTLPWVFFSISNPQVSQRLFTPGSMKDLRRMLLGFLIFGFVYTFVSVFWGFAARLHFPDLESSDMATPTLLGSDLVPTPLALIVMIGTLAACVSTIDSIMLTLSSTLSRDVYAAVRPQSSERGQLRLGKAALPVIAGLAYWFAHLELDLVAVLSVSASAGLLVLVPPTVGAFFWRRGTAAGVIVSVVVAGGLVFALEATGTLFLGQGSGVWGLLVSVVLFVGVSLLTAPPRDRAEEFIAASRRGRRETADDDAALAAQR